MICSKIENGVVVQTETVGIHRGKPLVVNGDSLSSNTELQHYLDAGWRQYIAPAPTNLQVITHDIVVDATTYTYALRDKTQAELNAEAQEAADASELEAETVASPLSGVTFAQAEAYIDNNVADLASAKGALKKLAKAILIINKRIGI